MNGGKSAYRPLKRLTYIIRAAWRTGEKISESMDFTVKIKFFQVISHRGEKKYILNRAFSLGWAIIISYRKNNYTKTYI